MFQPELITLTKRQAAGGVRSSDGSGFGCSESKLGEKKVGESIISDKDSEYMLIPLQPIIGNPLYVVICPDTPVLDDTRQFQALFLQLTDLYILDDRLGCQHQGSIVLLPPAMLLDLTEMDHSYQILPVCLRMPFLYPFKPVPGDVFPVIEAYIYPDEEITRQLMGLVMIELFVFVFVLITQR